MVPKQKYFQPKLYLALILIFMTNSSCRDNREKNNFENFGENKSRYSECFGVIGPESDFPDCRADERTKIFLEFTRSESSDVEPLIEKINSTYPAGMRRRWSLNFYKFSNDDHVSISKKNWQEVYGVLQVGGELYYFVPRSYDQFSDVLRPSYE